MRRRMVSLGLHALALVLIASAASCGPAGGPKTGTQTNWLRSCQSDSECGGLRCLCGACSRTCNDEASCTGLAGAACVPADDEGAIALCAGSSPGHPGICLPPCGAEGCASGTSCVAGVCTPAPTATAIVEVDDSQRFQTLVGIGAAVGYVFDEIAQHPRKEALFDAMFSGSGLTVLRLRNRYGQPREEDLESTGELVSAATGRLGRTPTIILNSASPPGSLKENGSNWCEGNPDTCTLARLPDGTFDYAGLASHWRASLEAYAAVSVEPDYISIQNNPDWVPAPGDANEACRFLPAEGTMTIAGDTDEMEVEYPGYAEALEAVLAELAGLPSVPRIVAPETTGFAEVQEYVAELDLEKVDAIAHHLYNTDVEDLDLAALAALGELAQRHELPLFQSEMHADPLKTAVLMHASLAVEGASVYIENIFVTSPAAIDDDPGALITLTEEDFVIGDNHHVMGHYSRHLEPGWTRVAADSDSEEVLASAWISPDGSRRMVVLTNPGGAQRAVRIDAGQREWSRSQVNRTVLRGIERSAELGPLPLDAVVVMPSQSLVTVTMSD